MNKFAKAKAIKNLRVIFLCYFIFFTAIVPGLEAESDAGKHGNRQQPIVKNITTIQDGKNQLIFYYNFLKSRQVGGKQYFESLSGSTAEVVGNVSLFHEETGKNPANQIPSILGKVLKFDPKNPSLLKLNQDPISTDITLCMNIWLDADTDQMFIASPASGNKYNLFLGWFKGTIQAGINSSPNEGETINLSLPEKGRIKPGKFHQIIMAVKAKKSKESRLRFYIDGQAVNQEGFSLATVIKPEQHVHWELGGPSPYCFTGMMGPVFAFKGGYDADFTSDLSAAAEASYSATHLLANPPFAKGIATQKPEFLRPDPLAGLREMEPMIPDQTGNAVIEYPLNVPPGIQNFKPSLSVAYSSNLKRSNLGVGWTIPFHTMEVDTRQGVPAYDGTDPILLNGKEIVQVAENQYRLKTDDVMCAIVKRPGNYFIAIQPDGTKYFYGKDESSRIFNMQNPSCTAVWLLSYIEDPCGNQIHFEYEAKYNAVSGKTYCVYKRPKYIHYGYASAIPKRFSHRIEIVWRAEGQYHKQTNLRPGFPTENHGLIEEIRMQFRATGANEAFQTLWKYRFIYSRPGYRTLDKYLLASLTELYGPDDCVVNQCVFNYHEAGKIAETHSPSLTKIDAFSDPVSFQVPDFDDFNENYRADDATLRHMPLGYSEDTDLNGDQSDDLREQYAMIEFMDINGDNLPDFIGKHRAHSLDVILNTGNGFVKREYGTYFGDALSYQQFSSKTYGPILTSKMRLLRDINADGRPDVVEQVGNTLIVQANGIGGFLSTPWTIKNPMDWAFSGTPYPALAVQDIYYHLPNEAQHTMLDLVDMNGDALPDMVLKPAGSDFEVRFNGFNHRKATMEEKGDGYFPHPAFNGEFGNRSVWTEGLALTGREDFQDLRMFRRYGYFHGSSAPHYYLHWYKGVNVDLQDINGDGLPDRIAHEGAHYDKFEDGQPKFKWNLTVPVQLNTGSGFVNYHSWEAPVNLIIGDPWQNIPLIGWHTRGSKITGAYPANKAATGHHMVSTLLDLDGDGLLDRLACNYNYKTETTYIQFNTGDGFSEKYYELDIVGLGYSSTGRIYEKPEYEYHIIKTRRYNKAAMIDVTGDGLPDQVEKANNSDTLYYRPNQLTFTNLLKEITNTQTFTHASLEYGLQVCDRTADNYRLQKVLKKLTLANTTVSPAYRKEVTFDYGKGVYDNLAREFRGFKSVKAITKYPNGPVSRELNPASYQTVEYEVERDTHTVDEAHNLVYDPDMKQQISSMTRGIIIPTYYGQKYIPTEKTEYIYEKFLPLADSETYPDRAKVALVLPVNIWNKVYNHAGVLLGELGKVYTYEIDRNGFLHQAKVELKGPLGQTPIHTTTLFLNCHALFDAHDERLRFLMAPKECEMKQNEKTAYKISLTYQSDILKPYRHKQQIYLQGNDTSREIIKKYGYDRQGNINSIVERGINSLVSTTYRSVGSAHDPFMERTVSIPGHPSIKSSFDVAGRLIASVDAYGDRTTNRYDEKGRLAGTSKEINGRAIALSQFVYMLEGFNAKTEATYAYPNNPIAGADSSLTMHYYKDFLGRDLQVKQESDVKGVRAWSVSGKIEYDFKGRVLKTGLASSAPITNTSFINTALVHPSEYLYNRFGKLSKITCANGLVITKEYEMVLEGSPLGTLLQVETTADNEGHWISVYRDGLGQIVKKKQKTGRDTFAETRFNYNLLGHTTIIEPESGLSGEIQVDSLGRLCRQKTPDAGVKDYHYNSRNLLTEVVDYGLDTTLDEDTARRTRLSYDRFNRLESVDFPGQGSDVLYSYYPSTGDSSSANKYRRANIQSIKKGDLDGSELCNMGFQVDYDYRTSDYPGGYYTFEESKQIKGERYTTKYHYDFLGRISVLEYPRDSELIGYFYDRGARLTGISGFHLGSVAMAPYLKKILYNERGQRTQVEYGNGNIIDYNYQANTPLLDEMKLYNDNAIKIPRGDGWFILEDEVLLDFKYDYYLASGIKKLGDYGKDSQKISEQTYSYDPANRISASTGLHQDGSAYLRGYDFDNSLRQKIKKFSWSSDSLNYDFTYANGRHAVDAIEINNSPAGKKKVQFGYNGFGCLISQETHYTSGMKTTRNYAYDGLNRLSQINDPNFNLDFDYDHMGQRTNKTYTPQIGGIADPTNASETRYVNGVYSLKDSMANKHISDGKYVFATQVGNLPSQTLYYAPDHLGSTIMITNNLGKPVYKRLYLPFGETWHEEKSLAPGEPLSVERLYTNQIQDESGLYYYNARYYDPDLGVFLTPDPAASGLNHYVYATGNPILYSDPSGEISIREVVIILLLAMAGGALNTYVTRDETTTAYNYARSIITWGLTAGMTLTGAWYFSLGFAGGLALDGAVVTSPAWFESIVAGIGTGTISASTNYILQMLFETVEYFTLPENNHNQQFEFSLGEFGAAGIGGITSGVLSPLRADGEVFLALPHLTLELGAAVNFHRLEEHFRHNEAQQGSAGQGDISEQRNSNNSVRDVDAVDDSARSGNVQNNRIGFYGSELRLRMPLPRIGVQGLNPIFISDPVVNPQEVYNTIPYFDNPIDTW